VQPKAHRRLPFYLVSMVLVGLLIASVAGVQALASQTSFRLDDLTRRSDQLQQRQGELRLELAELSSAKNIQRQAKRIGLVLPGPATLLPARSPGGSR
jgi:cell division protein FtsL